MTKLKRSLLSAAVLLVAFVLRVVAIDQIPPGLSHDEAYNGVTAIQVLNGQRLIFFEINKGIEPLIIYLEALAFYAFGIGPVQLRLVNIFSGLLTVALVYPLTARLFNRRVALLAMAGVTISFWAIFVSRLTLRAVTMPPLLILTLYLLWRGLTDNSPSQSRHLQYFTLSGLAAGASMYTYLSSRFVPLLVLAVFGYLLIWRQIRGYHWTGLIIYLVIWAAVVAPLANYYWQNAASFTERSSQVTTIPHALNGEFGPMARNTQRTLGMFTFQGDTTDRYNLDARPVFDWANGLFFYIGLGLVGLRLRRPPREAGPAALLLLWLFFMLLPDFITDDSPHFLRTFGTLPAVYILWAIGLDWSTHRFGNWVKSRVASQPLRFPFHVLRSMSHRLAILVLLLLATFHTTYDYFIRWASASEARSIYGADIAAVARYLKSTEEEGLVALSTEYYRDLDPFRLTIHFAGQTPFILWFDGRQTLAFPPAESGLSPRYVFAASAPPAEVWLPLLQASTTESGQAYTLYRLPDTWFKELETSLFPPKNGLSIILNDDLILSNYRVLGEIVSGGKFHVLLGWKALRPLPPGTDYTFLVRMWDHQGHLWTEDDGNGFPPVNWQPGIQGLQLLTLRLPGDLPPRTYDLSAEVVDRRTGEPLSTEHGETTIRLTTLPGRLANKPRQIELERLPNPLNDLPQTDTTKPLLRGYKVNQRSLRAGDTLSATMHWQVLEQPQNDFLLAFSLRNERGAVYWWPPLEPIGGEWPTGQWPADYWVQDKLDLPIGPNVPEGQFTLSVEWTDQSAESLPKTKQVGSGGFELGSVILKGE